MANAVTFWKGTKEKYDALPAEKKVDTRIFFCEDTGEIFKGTVRFSKELLTDYDTTEGVNEKIAKQYLPKIQFQGEDLEVDGTVVDGIGPTINFIGIGNVTTDANGNITVRLGENLNCSMWNGTDGISKATVTSAKSGDATATVSDDYSETSSCGSKQIFYGTDNITANAGSTATTTAGATSNNGNEVHFDDNSTCYFRVNIIEGKATTATQYLVGPISSSTDYTNKGIKCTVGSFGEEPKKASGASGYSGTVNFTITPASMGWTSKDFKLVSIEQVKISSAGATPVVQATWTNNTTNGSYFYLAENTSTYKAGDVSTASYAFDAVKTTKISGVTYLLNTSTVKVSATGLKNLGYPANSGTKVKVGVSGGAWLTAYNESDTSKFTTWTTTKDTVMAYESAAKTINIGKWDNPEVTVTGSNLIGDGASAASSESYKIIVCDDSGYVTEDHGSFSTDDDGTLEDGTLATDALMVYDGMLVYPSADFTGYNAGLIGNAHQPNYSSEATSRSYTKTFTLSGPKTKGSVTLETTSNIKSVLNSGDLKVEVKAKGGEWRDISENGIGQSSSSYGDTSTRLDFVFAFDTDYPNKTTGTAVRITMGSNVASIKSITLA